MEDEKKAEEEEHTVSLYFLEEEAYSDAASKDNKLTTQAKIFVTVNLNQFSDGHLKGFGILNNIRFFDMA